MKVLSNLNGVRVLALDGAQIEFADEEGEIVELASIPVGRHDLSKYASLVMGDVILTKMQIIASKNASETMRLTDAQMLSTSVNVDREVDDTQSPQERRYQLQILKKVEQNRENRKQQQRDLRVHEANAQKIIEQKEREKIRDEERREIKRFKKREQEVLEELQSATTEKNRVGSKGDDGPAQDREKVADLAKKRDELKSKKAEQPSDATEDE